MTTITQNGIEFMNIHNSNIYSASGKYSISMNDDGNCKFDTTLTGEEISKSFNSIEIDWNGARLPNVDPLTGGQKIINTSGELIQIINSIQKEIHILTDIIFSYI